jgi:hypothetical protein
MNDYSFMYGQREIFCDHKGSTSNCIFEFLMSIHSLTIDFVHEHECTGIVRYKSPEAQKNELDGSSMQELRENLKTSRQSATAQQQND